MKRQCTANMTKRDDDMALAVSVWLLKSVAILGIFHFILPPVVHATTRNSWAKFPVMVALWLMAGVFMALLHYVPYLLCFLWLALNKFTLEAMVEAKFEAQSQMRVRKSVFYVSSYTYIVIACASAWFLQMEIAQRAEPGSPWIPVWKYLIGG